MRQKHIKKPNYYQGERGSVYISRTGEKYHKKQNNFSEGAFVTAFFAKTKKEENEEQKVKIILKEIGSWMEKKGRPFTLYTEASINLADDQELMDLMKKANFNMVFVGIETRMRKH